MLIHGRFSLPLARASAFTIRRATIPLASSLEETMLRSQVRFRQRIVHAVNDKLGTEPYGLG
jgi:hypothetical protein